MRCYLIRDTRITVVAQAPASVPDDTLLVRTSKDLDQNRFPVARLVALWNALPDAEPVQRFRDRKTALSRLWAAIEKLPLSSSRTDSKQAKVVAMLRRPAGATVEQLMAATGWQRHSVRGTLSGVVRKKLGLALITERQEDKLIYRVSA